MQTFIDPDSTFRPMRLGGGEALHIPVRAGTAVQVLAGAVRLASPARWIAESMYRDSQQLAEGEWFLVEDGGWLALEASSAIGAHLLLAEPAEPVAWLWRRLRALLVRASGRGAARQPV